MEVANLINQIDALPADWHRAGAVGGNVLRTIAQHTERIGVVRNSAETGSGKTTLLFHISPPTISSSRKMLAIALVR